MKFAVFFDTPIPRANTHHRTYLQQAGSLGYKFDRFATWENWDETQDRTTAPICTLDSRILLLDTPKQADEVARNFGDAYTRYKGIHTVGYHGVTENGNACPPFVTVVHGSEDSQQDVAKRHKHWMDLNKAFNSMLLPKLISRSAAEVGRECDFTYGELFDEAQYIFDNLVEEELDQVMGTLNSMANMNFRVTGWDKYAEAMTIHFTRDPSSENEKPFHTTVTICALNLFNEAGIKQLADLAARREAVGEV